MSLLFRNRTGVPYILNYYYNLRIQGHRKILCQFNIMPAFAKSTGRTLDTGTATANPMPFEKMVKERRKEAERSILVQVHSEHSSTELNQYCMQCADVKAMYHYSLPGSLHFVLVEFNHSSEVDRILGTCSFNAQDVIPVKSPFLWFRAPIKSAKPKKKVQLPSVLVEVNGNTVPTQKEIRNLLHAAETFSDQILILHRVTHLGDLGSRLRFFAARQLELALKGLFPDVSALPFGSSVNGFGRALCDLDLVLLLDGDIVEESETSRLIFHAKNAFANERTQIQRHMETLGDICQFLLPGCSNVRRILNARVPIIKYHQDFTGLEIDLSMTNMTAVYMSELLYVFGEMDWRVRPLASAIKYWAREVGITNPTPGRWITNFSLMLLIVFYLQQKPAILPTLNTLMATLGPKDKQAIQQGKQSSLFKDISHSAELQLNKNVKNLESLFLGFFEFYASFDFDIHAVSVINGSTLRKPEHSAMYIVNPLEQGLNVSKNVSYEEVERFRMEVKNAAWILESVMTSADQGIVWGFNAVFQVHNRTSFRRNLFHMPTEKHRNERLMDLADIFESDNDKISAKNEKSHSNNKRTATAASDMKRR